MYSYLDFEKPIADLDGQIMELKKLSEGEDSGVDVAEEVARLEKRSAEALVEIYKKLTPWQKAQVARHPDRPHCLQYVDTLFEEFTLLAGDRNFAEDNAIIAGFARFNGQPVAVIGQEKGTDTKSRLKHNFGMARPEGYRKAVRLMQMADRFGLPVITWSIRPAPIRVSARKSAARPKPLPGQPRCASTWKCRWSPSSSAKVVPAVPLRSPRPTRSYMLEHAIYSVISPEGGASILWRDAARAKDAATAMKITAQDLLSLKVIDGIINEPLGGAHRDVDAVMDETRKTIAGALADLVKLDGPGLKKQRREKFLAIGRNLG
jgi:acetyl-CoA carboxylase carboxyl transferase subunit alpha